MSLLILLTLAAASLIGLLILLGIVFAMLGRSVPEEHRATVAMEIAATPEHVFALLLDAPGHAKWAAGVTGVELVRPATGPNGLGASWRQCMGRNLFILTTTVSMPPADGRAGELERTIADENGPFSGSWMYHVKPSATTPGHTTLSLTETGRVKSAIPRAIMRYLVGYTLYARKHLASVQRHFAQNPSMQ